MLIVNESLWIVDAIARETMLFAATGILIGGIDDLVVDGCYFWQRMTGRHERRLTLSDVAHPSNPGHLAIFVAAWDESRVIGAMLRSALARIDHDDYRIYVALYPNDRATIDAAAAVAERDARVRLVIGGVDGPTTKADNLNRLWAAMCADEAREGIVVKAVVLHDAEDVVHSGELRVFDTLIERYAVVQLPVLPLVKRGSRLVSGHYADEFAESHSVGMVVRTSLGAGMPLAGTGCAIARDVLAGIADERGGEPFDATSLTEDYELGLRIAERGGRGIFARIAAGDDGDRDTGALVAVRAYFPATLPAATRQKARWMTGIALAGWDRTGWSAAPHWRDHWMRMRDRRAPLAVLVLAIAYVAVLAWGSSRALHWALAAPLPGDALATWLLGATTAILVWRLAMRIACTARCYGWREASWSVPRFFVGNIIALVAAPRAIVRYLAMLRGATPVWDKTRHDFPTESALFE